MNGRLRATALLLLLTGTVLVAGQAPAGQPAPAQQGPETPTFKVQVDYIEVDAFVTDQQGRFVRNLKKEDFEVFEDGKRQTVSAFTLVDIPVERAVRPLFAAQPIEPDVRTNARPFDGRIYIVVLTTHRSSSTHGAPEGCAFIGEAGPTICAVVIQWRTREFTSSGCSGGGAFRGSSPATLESPNASSRGTGAERERSAHPEARVRRA